MENSLFCFLKFPNCLIKKQNFKRLWSKNCYKPLNLSENFWSFFWDTGRKNLFQHSLQNFASAVGTGRWMFVDFHQNIKIHMCLLVEGVANRLPPPTKFFDIAMGAGGGTVLAGLEKCLGHCSFSQRWHLAPNLFFCSPKMGHFLIRFVCGLALGIFFWFPFYKRPSPAALEYRLLQCYNVTWAKNGLLARKSIMYHVAYQKHEKISYLK